MSTSTSTKALEKTVIRDQDGMAIGASFVFSNGERITVGLGKLNPAMFAESACHGLIQKIGDGAALPCDTKTGRPPSVADKHTAALTIAERIIGDEGQWNATREGGGNEGGMLARAVAELKAMPLEKAREWVAARTADEKAALMLNPAIKRLVDAMRAARVKADVDTDALLDSIGN